MIFFCNIKLVIISLIAYNKMKTSISQRKKIISQTCIKILFSMKISLKGIRFLPRRLIFNREKTVNSIHDHKNQFPLESRPDFFLKSSFLQTPTFYEKNSKVFSKVIVSSERCEYI